MVETKETAKGGEAGPEKNACFFVSLFWDQEGGVEHGWKARLRKENLRFFVSSLEQCWINLPSFQEIWHDDFSTFRRQHICTLKSLR